MTNATELQHRLGQAVARLKAYTDATPGVYTVPGVVNVARLAVLADDLLMAQYRLSEAADALSTAYRQGLQDAAGVAANTVRHVNLYRGRPIVSAILALNPTDATEGETANPLVNSGEKDR